MRILCVTPYYKPEGGGLERYAHEILRRLGEEGHDVEAVSFTRQEHPSQTVEGVPVRRVEPWFCLGNAPVHPGFGGIVADRIEAFDPDVVLGHTPVPFPAAMAYRAARRQGTPFVATYHAGRLRGSSPALDALAAVYRSTVQQAMLAGSERLIAVGPFVRGNALDGHESKTVIIPPGVDTDSFRPGPGTRPSVLFVGPLSSSYTWKGLDTLWEAFQHVHGRVPSAELTLIGSGDRRDEFARRRDHEGLPVRLPGRVPFDRLVEEYQRAGMLVLPSTSEAESFGMVMAEANACGRPVIGSRIGGIPDFVIEGDNGLLASPGDATELAEQITRLLLDPAEANRMGERGRKRVLRDHTWPRLANRTEAVLEAVAGSDAG